MALFKRRILLVKPEFQIPIIVYLVFVSVLVGAFCLITNYVIFQSFQEKMKILGIQENATLFSFIYELQNVINFAYFLILIMLIVLFAILGMYISNRIAGPISRIEKHIDDRLEKRHGRRLNFRKKDFFPELADAINKILPPTDKNAD